MAYSSKQTTELVSQYVSEFTRWRDDLKQYWPEMEKDEEMYEFYKRESSETGSDVSLNTAFAIVESMVSRINDTAMTVTVRGRGGEGLDDFENYVSHIIKNAMDDPDVAQFKGTFRKNKEVFVRQFLVVGNAVAEDQYCYVTGIQGDKKVVLADNPYTVTLPWKSYIFNPAETFDTASVQYLEKHVSWEQLKAQEKDPKTGKGIYINLGSLRRQLSDMDKQVDATEEHYFSGDRRITRRVEPIRILERWEGAKLCVIAMTSTEGGVLIREEYDPKQIGGSGIKTAMNYKVQGRPYARGEIAAIYKAVRAQDTVLNQSIEMVNKYLRPTIFVRDTDADLEDIIIALEDGGVTYGDFTAIGSPQSNLPPSAAFQSIETIQQAIERSARFGLGYSAGASNQASDKTQGTKGGIMALQAAAEPNLQIKLDALEECYAEPTARNYLKMIGNLMGSTDVRYSLVQGKTTEWVKATKGILTGKATIQDLLTTEIIQPDDIPGLVGEMNLQPNQTDIRKTVIFDVDWMVDVKLDNQSEALKQQEFDQDVAFIQLGQELGVPFNPERTWTYLAKKRGMENVEEIMLTPEEQQQQAQAMAGANAPEQKHPSESINFKDLPPHGQAQLAQQAGIDLTPEDFINHAINQGIMSKLTPPQPFAQPQQAGVGNG